jgi:hypothetical protein
MSLINSANSDRHFGFIAQDLNNDPPSDFNNICHHMTDEYGNSSTLGVDYG